MTDALRRPIVEAVPLTGRADGAIRPATAISGRRTDYGILLPTALRLADAGLIAGFVILGSSLASGNLAGEDPYWFDVVLTLLLTEIYFDHAGLYELSGRGHASSWLSRLALAWAGVGVTILALDQILKLGRDTTGMWPFVLFVPAFGGFAVVRMLMYRYLSNLRRTGKLAHGVAIVGSRDAARRLVTRLAPRFGTEANLVGVFEIARGDRGFLEQLTGLCRNGMIDDIFIALEWGETELLDTILGRLRSFAVNVRLVPELPGGKVPCLSIGEFCGVPAISMVEHPLTEGQAAAKRALDIVVTLGALIFVLPLMLFVAAAIRLDSPGAALFRQERWGFNAGRIVVLKFRTMRIDAGADPKAAQAQRKDPRVTRIGWWLRRTSLDELPQLMNVLRGDMSLVGPRPHAVAHNEFYTACIENYLGRHRLKPGITGLAQVNGCRGGTDTLDKMQRRVEYDMLYIENWSLWLDLKILYMTLFVGFTHPNAY